MKTKECIIKNAISNYETVFTEVKLIAQENKLSKKQELGLTLLVEETLGIPKGILGFTEGVIYVENEDDKYTIHFESAIHVGKIKKEELISVSTDGENGIYQGFKGMLRKIADHMITETASSTVPLAEERAWYYKVYFKEHNSKNEAWDEYEKSILVNFADDIVIKVKNDKLEILVIKKL